MIIFELIWERARKRNQQLTSRARRINHLQTVARRINDLEETRELGAHSASVHADNEFGEKQK